MRLDHLLSKEPLIYPVFPWILFSGFSLRGWFLWNIDLDHRSASGIYCLVLPAVVGVERDSLGVGVVAKRETRCWVLGNQTRTGWPLKILFLGVAGWLVFCARACT